MVLTLVSRSGLDILRLYDNIVGMRVLGLVIAMILGFIEFIFIGHCLARIGDADGERVVMKYNVVRIARRL